MTDETELDTVAKIRDRLAEEALKEGLKIVPGSFAMKPGAIGGPHAVSAIFVVETDDELEERKKIQIQIKQIERDRDEERHEETLKGRANEAQANLENLQERLRDPKKGILDD